MRSSPVRMTAWPDEPGRWLWLVKWLLLIPHYIVLAVLWVAFVALTVIAYVAVLFTGRYPAGIHEFNVGVLRWTWRVGYYGYSALARTGTRRSRCRTCRTTRPGWPSTRRRACRVGYRSWPGCSPCRTWSSSVC